MPVTRTVLGAGLLSVVLMVAACGGGDDRASPASLEVNTSPTLVGPDAFAGRIEAPGVVTINVHTPDEGSISGTDLTIPFDQIRESPALPADRDTPLAIYCRSDNMSADAVDDLVALGYTDIVELDGGFNAWAAAGRPLQPAAD